MIPSFLFLSPCPLVSTSTVITIFVQLHFFMAGVIGGQHWDGVVVCICDSEVNVPM
jgi:hypothetical protein